MNDSKLRSVAQIKAFLVDTGDVGLSAIEGNDQARYDFIHRTLSRFDYPNLSKRDKGVIRAYLIRLTGYSRSQVTRLIERYDQVGCEGVLRKRYSAPKSAFARRYTPLDLALLVQVDMAYNNVCGATTVAVLKRQFEVYGDERFANLSNLSASHLYNLRASRPYKAQRLEVVKTRAVQVPIGVRKAPAPNGRAGFIRVDTVHQGDEDRVKGVYHITCVDSVTQWSVTTCVQGISEAFLLEPLEQAMAQFPFEIVGFHSDNGSEYINARVAKLLEKLRVEQTKSRSRHSNDNALAESKNNSIVRRHMGYEHIPKALAKPINAFYLDTFNPWVNYHRPCLFAKEVIGPKGKVYKKYENRDVQTPLDKLTGLCAQGLATLRSGITLKALHQRAQLESDLQATHSMQQAKATLWQRILKAKQQRYAQGQPPSTTQAEHPMPIAA